MASNQRLGPEEFGEASDQHNATAKIKNEFRSGFKKFFENYNRQHKNVEDFIPELTDNSNNENHFKRVVKLLNSMTEEKDKKLRNNEKDSDEDLHSFYSGLLRDLIQIYFDAVKVAEQLGTRSEIEKCHDICKSFLEKFCFCLSRNGILLKKNKERYWLTEISSNEKVLMAYCEADLQINFSDTETVNLLTELGKEPLKQNCIILLNRITKLCITSDVADGAKKYAFVAYNIRTRGDNANQDSTENPAERAAESSSNQLKEPMNQAEKEADKLLKWLRKEDYEVTSLMDWKKKNFSGELVKFLKTAKKDCSLAVVFIMAHGCEGKVFDVNKRSIKLREIEDIINNAGFPKEIPRILIVQACRSLGQTQSGSSNNTDDCVDTSNSELSDPQETPSVFSPSAEESLDALSLESTEAGTVVQHETDGRDIRKKVLKVLQKTPNKQNPKAQQTAGLQPKASDNYVGFIKIMACAKGEEANRNTFIPLLIEQLNEGFSICTAVDNTVACMGRPSSTPEITRSANHDVYLTKTRVQSGK